MPYDAIAPKTHNAPSGKVPPQEKETKHPTLSGEKPLPTMAAMQGDTSAVVRGGESKHGVNPTSAPFVSKG